MMYPITSAIFLGLFGVLFFTHIALAHRYRYKERFTGLLIIAALLETLGYVLQLVDSGINTGYVNAGIGITRAWVIIIMHAPIFINAFIYALLSRLYAQFLPNTPLLGLGYVPNLILPALSIVDIVPQVVQFFGLLKYADVLGDDTSGSASVIVLFVSFILQYIPLLIFLACLIGFTIKSRQALRSGEIVISRNGSQYRGLTRALWVAIICLLIRLTYYTYNAGSNYYFKPTQYLGSPTTGGRYKSGWIFKMGALSYHKSHDYNDDYMLYSLLFESIPMFLTLLAFAYRHPGRRLRKVDELKKKRWVTKYRLWKNGDIHAMEESPELKWPALGEAGEWPQPRTEWRSEMGGEDANALAGRTEMDAQLAMHEMGGGVQKPQELGGGMQKPQELGGWDPPKVVYEMGAGEIRAKPTRASSL